MKWTILALALVALCLQGASARAQSSLEEDPFDPDLNENDLSLEDLDELFERLENATRQGAQVGKELAEQLSKRSQEFLAQVETYTLQIQEGIRSFLRETITHFASHVQEFQKTILRGLQTVRNLAVRRSLVGVLTLLQQIEELSTNLQSNVDKVREELLSEAERGRRVVLDNWQVWETRQLEEVRSATNKNAEAAERAGTVLNDFFNQYANQLVNCADEAEVELQNFEESVQTSVDEYENALEKLHDEVENCIEATDNVVNNVRCTFNINILNNKLINAPRELRQLTLRGAGLLAVTFKSRVCVVRTLAKFEVGKLGVAYKIRQIIQEANQGSGDGERSEASDEGDADDGDVDESDVHEGNAEEGNDNGQDADVVESDENDVSDNSA